MENRILILGRPNVGKSSLFNRLVGSRIAIVDKIPHVTRDCIEEDVVYNDRLFKIIDSSGFTTEDGELRKKINNIIETTLEDVDLVLFVVDGKTGIHPLDGDIYKKLKSKGVPFLLVVNKIDEEKEKFNALEFYKLGVKEFITVSAAHGKNIDELIDYLLEYFQNTKALPENMNDLIKIAIVGRPNVGKSSFINKIIGDERVLVTNIPGTTRDFIKLPCQYKGKRYILIDTAGLKKKNSMMKDPIEKACMYKAFKGIEISDVVIYMIDSTEGLSGRDVQFISQVLKLGKAIVFAVNKWDLVKEKNNKKIKLHRSISESFFSLGKPYVSFISALDGTNIYTVLEDVRKVYKKYNSEIKTSLLNEIIQAAQMHYQPPIINGKRVKIYYVTQIASKPPRFLFFVNYPEGIQESYKRYIINTLRETLKLRSIPIELTFKERKREGRISGSNK
jgi:GTP-binding protein